jgi:hypothetical protein
MGVWECSGLHSEDFEEEENLGLAGLNASVRVEDLIPYIGVGSS